MCETFGIEPYVALVEHPPERLAVNIAVWEAGMRRKAALVAAGSAMSVVRS